MSQIPYNDGIWYSYTLPKEDPEKYINHVAHLLSSAVIRVFLLEISNLCYPKKSTFILILLTFFESLNVILIKMVAFLMMSAI